MPCGRRSRHGALARIIACGALAAGLLLPVVMMPGPMAQNGTAPGRPAGASVTVTQSAPDAAIAIDARLDGNERTARFAMAVSRRLDVTFEALDQPLRIVVALPEVNFQAAAPKARKGALVPQFRAGLVAPGRSRIVFDLAQPAGVKSLQQRARPDGVIDFSIEFEPLGRTEFDALVAAGAERRARAALPARRRQPPPAA